MNVYRGIGLLTKSEEKRFPKEREILEWNKDEESDEEKVRAEEITRATAQGPVRVEVVIAEEGSQQRSAKRQKIAEASVAARRLEAQMVRSAATRLRTSRTRARPKKKAQCRVVVLEISDSSIAMSEGTSSLADEDAVQEEGLRTP